MGEDGKRHIGYKVSDPKFSILLRQSEVKTLRKIEEARFSKSVAISGQWILIRASP